METAKFSVRVPYNPKKEQASADVVLALLDVADREARNLRGRVEQIQKEMKKTLYTPPKNLCKSCREEWDRNADAVRHFLEVIYGNGDLKI